MRLEPGSYQLDVAFRRIVDKELVARGKGILRVQATPVTSRALRRRIPPQPGVPIYSFSGSIFEEDVERLVTAQVQGAVEMFFELKGQWFSWRANIRGQGTTIAIEGDRLGPTLCPD